MFCQVLPTSIKSQNLVLNTKLIVMLSDDREEMGGDQEKQVAVAGFIPPLVMTCKTKCESYGKLKCNKGKCLIITSREMYSYGRRRDFQIF